MSPANVVRHPRIVGVLGAVCIAGVLVVAGAASARADDVEERLRRVEAELEQAREEIEGLKRERAVSPTPTAAPKLEGSEAPPANKADLKYDPAKAGLPVDVRAAFGKGFTVTTLDDSFSVNLRARMQLRFTETVAAEDEDSTTELQVRRLRLVLQGHALTRDLTYNFHLGFSNLDTEADQDLAVRDAWLNYVLLKELQIRVGQMKVPFSRQQLNTSACLQLVDRSVVQGEFTLDRDVGAYVHSPDLLGGILGYSMGVFGGDGRNRLSSLPGVLLVGRVQLSPFGKFDSLSEGDLERSERPKLAIGAAAAWNENTNRPRSTTGNPYRAGSTDYVHLVSDAQLKWLGFSFCAEAHYRDAGSPAAQGFANGTFSSEPTRSGWGFFEQAGYMITEHLEIEERYGETRPLGSLTAIVPAHEAGAGLSYYILGHDLKVQADYFYLWPGTVRDGTHQIRAQVQFFF